MIIQCICTVGLCCFVMVICIVLIISCLSVQVHSNMLPYESSLHELHGQNQEGGHLHLAPGRSPGYTLSPCYGKHLNLQTFCNVSHLTRSSDWGEYGLLQTNKKTTLYVRESLLKIITECNQISPTVTT